MRLKSLLIVVSVLAALSALVAFLRRPAPPPSADARVGQALLTPATLDQATKLRLSDQGRSVTLARQSDGAWRVASYHDFPADFSKLSRLIDDLTSSKLQRLVTSNAERIARLEFKDTRLELLDAAEKPLWTVTLGKTAETGGRYLRFADEPKAYLANLNAWLDAEPKNWADSALLTLKPDDIATIELAFPSSDAAAARSLTFTRAKKEDPWTSSDTPANQTPNADKLTSLLTSLSNLRFSDTTAPDDPKAAEGKPHARAVKLTTFDHKTISLTFARKPEEKKLKPPAADAKSGPAALGSIADLAKADPKSTEKSDAGAPATEAAKPTAPEFETIPAGPVFVSVAHSDAAASINTLMQKRAFQIYDYAYTSLPQKPDELFTTPPPPPATPAPAATK